MEVKSVVESTDISAPATLYERVAARAATLPASERRVAEYMAQHPDSVAGSSAAEIAHVTGTSDATVIRTAKALGYPGLRKLKREVIDTLSRRRNPAHVLDDRLGRVAETDDALERVLLDSTGMLEHLTEMIDRSQWEQAVDALLVARRVFVYGIGPAAALSEYLAINLNRVGIDALALSATGFRVADGLLTMSADDLAFIFAPLRLFREIETVIEHATDVGARTIAVTEALGLVLSDRVDVVISTPQSTTNAASENMAGLVLAHALTLAIASHTHERSVETMNRLNGLRARVVGAELDAHPQFGRQH